MMNKKPPKKANWDYAPWGLLARCWCGHRLYSPEDECIGCVADYRKWELLKVIPGQEVEEAYQKADKEDDNWQQEGPDVTDPREQSKEFGQKDNKYDEKPGERNGWGVIEE